MRRHCAEDHGVFGLADRHHSGRKRFVNIRAEDRTFAEAAAVGHVGQKAHILRHAEDLALTALQKGVERLDLRRI